MPPSPVKGLEALKLIGHNLTTTLTQDSASLKVGAAFTSTLVHVLLRCGVSVQSARKAPPNDAYFVKRQSAEVLFRELVGFTLGYGVVKEFSKFLKSLLLFECFFRLQVIFIYTSLSRLIST